MTFDEFLESSKHEFPDVQIIPKMQNPWMIFIDKFLKIISFGTMNTFLTQFSTTIGHTIYVTPNFETLSDPHKIISIRHEFVHLRQIRKYGHFWFSFLYLFIFFPVCFSYFRMKFEMEAYEEGLRAIFQIFGKEELLKQDPNKTTSNFTSSQYLWTWIYRPTITKWYSEAIERVLSGK